MGGGETVGMGIGIGIGGATGDVNDTFDEEPDLDLLTALSWVEWYELESVLARPADSASKPRESECPAKVPRLDRRSRVPLEDDEEEKPLMERLLASN
jgi:hypothetical protein